MVHGMAHEQDLQILHPFFRLELKWEKWCEQHFFASLILYSQLLQFKVDLFSNIPFHEIEMLNIAKWPRKLPKLNVESHVQYRDKQKSFKRRTNFLKSNLPCA